MKKIFLAIFIFVSACNSASFMASGNEELQKIEKEDHQFCVSLGLDFGENELKTEIYWRCRITLAKSKIKSDALIPADLRRNISIKKLVDDIAKNYSESYEKWGNSRNSLFDNNDHRSCITQGHSLDSLEQTAVEDYFICRKRLINNQQIIPPFRKTEYFKRPQDTYNIGFAINKKTDKDIEKFEAVKAKYPKCVKFDFKGEEFKICKLDYDQQQQCFSKIDQLRSKRELQEKIACQKKSYIRFPDSMLKEDKREKEELEKARIAADISNNSNFFSIGINAEQLAKFKGEEILEKKDADKKADIAKTVDKKTDTTTNNKTADGKPADDKKIDPAKIIEKKPIKNFNTKNNLYDKVSLTKLRQKFIFACQEAISPDIITFGEKLQKECNVIVEKWENE